MQRLTVEDLYEKVLMGFSPEYELRAMTPHGSHLFAVVEVQEDNEGRPVLRLREIPKED